jgi:hypothetical protein
MLLTVCYQLTNSAFLVVAATYLKNEKKVTEKLLILTRLFLGGLSSNVGE